MKFLIDECLSPTLAAIARTHGFPESTHVTWVGFRSRADWDIVLRVREKEFVLVTHDRVDFTPLMERERTHPGLVCINVAHGLMSLNVLQTMFEYALRYIATENIERQVVEKSLMTEGTVR
ncbi:MAG: DUF5615 family PIN-like protein, partial [Pseudomonadales bacterium]|nr:DUF5615 family PIN-like protein [Pseudomonadales bacterium]